MISWRILAASASHGSIFSQAATMSQRNQLPSLPETAISNADLTALADQIRMLVMSQSNRDNRMMEQVEVQLALFERLQHRLDEIEGRLNQIPAALADLTESDSNRRAWKAEPPEEVANDYSLSPALASWQEQRDQMLKSLGAETPQAEIPEPRITPAPTAEPVFRQCHELPLPAHATPDEANEIEALKSQLKAAIREMELECSVQRARLSRERMLLDEKEAELAQREKNLLRQPQAKRNKRASEGSIVSRLKGFLGHAPDES